jgi:hypothetical protein
MEKFKTTKGLRQGCCLSPTLLKIYSEKPYKDVKVNVETWDCT